MPTLDIKFHFKRKLKALASVGARKRLPANPLTPTELWLTKGNAALDLWVLLCKHFRFLVCTMQLSNFPTFFSTQQFNLIAADMREC